ncbi:MAG: hypothetical protein ABWY93_09840 [Mycobacterium sp.]
MTIEGVEDGKFGPGALLGEMDGRPHTRESGPDDQNVEMCCHETLRFYWALADTSALRRSIASQGARLSVQLRSALDAKNVAK